MALTDQQVEYIESLGATDALFDRTRSLLRTYQEVLGTGIEDLFISEYVSKADGRVFEALWVFADGLIGEAEIPEDEGDHLDIVPLDRSVHHLIVEKQSYNLRRAVDSSRLTVEVWFSAQRVGINAGDRPELRSALALDYDLPPTEPSQSESRLSYFSFRTPLKGFLSLFMLRNRPVFASLTTGCPEFVVVCERPRTAPMCVT